MTTEHGEERKLLPKDKRGEYLRVAEVEYRTKLRKMSEQGLAFSVSGEDEAQDIHGIAQALWEADGYYEKPCEYVSIKATEERLLHNLCRALLPAEEDNDD